MEEVHTDGSKMHFLKFYQLTEKKYLSVCECPKKSQFAILDSTKE